MELMFFSLDMPVHTKLYTYIHPRGAAEICREFRPGKAAAKAAVLRLLRSLMRGPHWAPQAPRARLLDHNEVKFLRSVSKIVLLHKFLFHFKNFTGT